MSKSKTKRIKKRGWLNRDQGRPAHYSIDGGHYSDEEGMKPWSSVGLSIGDCERVITLYFDSTDYKYKISQLRSALDTVEGFIEENDESQKAD